MSATMTYEYCMMQRTIQYLARDFETSLVLSNAWSMKHIILYLGSILEDASDFMMVFCLFYVLLGTVSSVPVQIL